MKAKFKMMILELTVSVKVCLSMQFYDCTHVHVLFVKALGSNKSEINGQSSEITPLAALTVKPHPPDGVDQALLKTPPKRTTGIVLYISLL